MWLAPALSLHNASHPLSYRDWLVYALVCFVLRPSLPSFGSSFIHKLNGTFLWGSNVTDAEEEGDVQLKSDNEERLQVGSIGLIPDIHS